jgi:hypothetical protein
MAKAIQEVAEFFRVVILGVRDQPGAIVQQPEQAGVKHLAFGQGDGRSVHHVGHPKLIAEGTFKGLGGAGKRPAGKMGIVFHRARVQAVFDQQPVNRGHAEGARLEDLLFQQMADKGFDVHVREAPAPVQQCLAGLGPQGFAGSLVAARAADQCTKTFLAEAVEPRFERGGGVKLPAPVALTGQGDGTFDRVMFLDGLLDPANRRVPGQRQWIRRGFFCHARELGRRLSPLPE